jgi:hypothetical protein
MTAGAETKMQHELKGLLSELQIIASIIEQQKEVMQQVERPEKTSLHVNSTPQSLTAVEQLSLRLAGYNATIQNLTMTAKNTQQDVSTGKL